MFADLLQAPVVMVSDVPVGLTELLGNLFERMPFEEMQSERLPPVFGKSLQDLPPPVFVKRPQDLPPAVSTEETFDTLVVVCAFGSVVATFDRFVCDSGQIE